MDADSANSFSEPFIGEIIEWTIGTVSNEAEIMSPNIAPLLQALVNRAGWTSGNAIAFYISGDGSIGVVKSFDSSPGDAPEFQVKFWQRK